MFFCCFTSQLHKEKQKKEKKEKGRKSEKEPELDSEKLKKVCKSSVGATGNLKKSRQDSDVLLLTSLSLVYHRHWKRRRKNKKKEKSYWKWMNARDHILFHWYLLLAKVYSCFYTT